LANYYFSELAVGQQTFFGLGEPSFLIGVNSLLGLPFWAPTFGGFPSSNWLQIL